MQLHVCTARGECWPERTLAVLPTWRISCRIWQLSRPPRDFLCSLGECWRRYQYILTTKWCEITSPVYVLHKQRRLPGPLSGLKVSVCSSAVDPELQQICTTLRLPNEFACMCWPHKTQSFAIHFHSILNVSLQRASKSWGYLEKCSFDCKIQSCCLFNCQQFWSNCEIK